MKKKITKATKRKIKKNDALTKFNKEHRNSRSLKTLESLLNEYTKLASLTTTPAKALTLKAASNVLFDEIRNISLKLDISFDEMMMILLALINSLMTTKDQILKDRENAD